MCLTGSRAHRIGLTPPHPLPAEHCKVQSRKGVGDFVRPATVLSHNVRRLCSFFPCRRGKCCPFFSFCVFRVWFGVFCRFLSFFSSKGRFFGKIFGSELLFWGGCVGLVFFAGFLLMFLLYFFGVSLPKLFGKNSLLVRSGFFWVRSLFLRFILSSSSFFVCFFFVFSLER